MNDNQNNNHSTITMYTEYVGTFAYAPVEILKGRSYSGFEQDIWCLGIVLYMLCFRQTPFRTPKETLQGFLRLPISRPQSIVSLIRWMLAPNPDDRPKIYQIFESEFFIENYSL